MPPIKPLKVDAKSDSTLELRRAKTKRGNQGPENATMERLKTLGINETEYSIKRGVELMHLAETCW